MINRHNFESIKRNQKFIEVVSTNRRYFESIKKNRHNFEIIVYEPINTSDSWTITFNSVSRIVAVSRSEKFNPNVEIGSSSSAIINLTLTENINVEVDSYSTVEITLDFDGNMGNVEVSSTYGVQSNLLQEILVSMVGENAITHSIELSPEFRHYFVLNNYSGSYLSDLDASNLVNLDYELV